MGISDHVEIMKNVPPNAASTTLGKLLPKAGDKA
jgi:hypothetical protein